MKKNSSSKGVTKSGKSPTEPALSASLLAGASLIGLRPYQRAIFDDRKTGIVVLHWSRQIGKSFTLAAWAVDRLLHRPGRLVTVLSNSRENGAEFVQKCHEVCKRLDEILRSLRASVESHDLSPDLALKNMRLEVHIKSTDDAGVEHLGRIKVLAANPRTARGFSGDLILDEFAFHENSSAIWEAAEPILASNEDYCCRIASTGNGRHNLFYRLAAPKVSLENSDAKNGLMESQAGFPLSRITRTQAHALGVGIYDARTRTTITPEAARAQALDKRAYDQNYECAFADENLTLLSHDLISAAEQEGVGYICEQDWSNIISGFAVPAAEYCSSGNSEIIGRVQTPQSPQAERVRSCLQFLGDALGPLYVGFDVARKTDLSVITVLEKLGEMFYLRAILRIQNMRLPDQQMRLGEICRLPKFQRAAIDMTGLGLGLFEYAQKEFGPARIHGINFATTVPATRAIQQEGRKRETVRVTEALALELLQTYEDRRLRQPMDGRLRDDLRKPERVTTPSGRVSIAATRDEAGHADHFWSLALALEAAANGGAPFAYERIKITGGRQSNRSFLL